MEEISCEVLVVGGGMTGCLTAYVAASKGLDVIVVERKNEIASPLRGGEAASKLIWDQFCEAYPFLQKVPKFETCGTSVWTRDCEIQTYEQKWKAYIIERKSFEKTMAVNASKAGAKLLFASTLKSIKFEGKKAKSAEVKTLDGTLKIKPKIIVGADGFASTVRKILGVGTKLDKDWGCALEVEMANINFKTKDMIQIFIGDAPGGYAYIFPKLEGRGDVGVGLRPMYFNEKITPIEVFRKLIREHPVMAPQLKNASLIELKGGVIDLSGAIKEVHGNVVLVGDAANQNFAYIGEGILPSLTAAGILGDKLPNAVNGDYKALEEYPKEYADSFIGKEAHKTCVIKDNIGRVITSKLDKRIRDVLTSFLELEIIEWDGRELNEAMRCKNIRELLSFGDRLVKKKKMNSVIIY